MINYKKLKAQVHPLTSKVIPEYIRTQMQHQRIDRRKGYMFIPTDKQYREDIFPLTSNTSKKKFLKLVIEFFPETFTK